MSNQVVLVGRIAKDPTIKELENGKKVSVVTLAVARPYKNEEGEYDTDFIDCTLYGGVAENTIKYCKQGDIVGIKGRVQNGNEIIAEKVTFLTSSKENKEAV